MNIESVHAWATGAVPCRHRNTEKWKNFWIIYIPKENSEYHKNEHTFKHIK